MAGSLMATPGILPRLEIVRADPVLVDVAVRLPGNPFLVDFAAPPSPHPQTSAGGVKRRGKALSQQVNIVFRNSAWVESIHTALATVTFAGLYQRQLVAVHAGSRLARSLISFWSSSGKCRTLASSLASLAAAGHVTHRQSVENALRGQDGVLLGLVGPGHSVSADR